MHGGRCEVDSGTVVCQCPSAWSRLYCEVGGGKVIGNIPFTMTEPGRVGDPIENVTDSALHQGIISGLCPACYYVAAGRSDSSSILRFFSI